MAKYEGKLITLITGANQGIGYELALNLLTHSATYHVLIGSRDADRGAAAVKMLRTQPGVHGTVSSIQIDVTDDEGVNAAARSIETQYGRLDILVNNAGIVSMVMPPTPQVCRDVLNVNVVGPLSVTEAMLPLLRKAKTPRVVFVSSSTGCLSKTADPGPNPPRGTGFEYRSSKAALNMMMVLYRNRLQDEDFKVLAADPGLTATNFTGDAASLAARGGCSPAEGAERIAVAVRGERDEHLGRVVGVNGVVPW